MRLGGIKKEKKIHPCRLDQNSTPQSLFWVVEVTSIGSKSLTSDSYSCKKETSWAVCVTRPSTPLSSTPYTHVWCDDRMIASPFQIPHLYIPTIGVILNPSHHPLPPNSSITQIIITINQSNDLITLTQHH